MSFIFYFVETKCLIICTVKLEELVFLHNMKDILFFSSFIALLYYLPINTVNKHPWGKKNTF